MESHKIASVGTAAGNTTTVWQPLPDGPIVTIPAGSTNVPVTGIAGVEVGQKIAIGHGARCRRLHAPRRSLKLRSRRQLKTRAISMSHREKQPAVNGTDDGEIALPRLLREAS